ncbi:MAG: Localization factor PodJS, partial [Phenylobacterium sp.]
MKGIDPKAREVAKDLARRSGMTLGEWLNRVILEDDGPEEAPAEEHFGERPLRALAEATRPQLVSSNTFRVDELGRIAHALDRLADRIETSETRTGLAITSVEHAVRQTVARIEAAEREHVAIAARFESAVEGVATDHGRLAERLRRTEAETSGPRSAEALRALEQSVSRVAGQLYEGEGRNREALAGIEARMQRAESLTGGDPQALIDEVVRQLGQRLADAEGRAAEALENLRAALASLDGRVQGVEGGASPQVEQRLQDLAAHLTQRIEAARAEVAQKLAAGGAERIDLRLAEVSQTVAAAEQRSARAIEAMGREVVTIAETLNRRVLTAEQRSAQAIELVGGEVARIAGAVEARLDRANQANAEALERLGAEIGRVTERLTDRLLHTEQRVAQAIDDVGEQVARVTERFEQRQDRGERGAGAQDASHPLGEQPTIEADAGGPPVAAAPFGPELLSRAEVDEDFLPHAPDEVERPMFAAAQDAEADDGFAAIPEPKEDLFGLEQPEPPVPEADIDAARPLSTREVIAQARAAARAASGVRAPTLQAKAAWRQPAKPASALAGVRGRLAPHSALQTAFMVAGGAGFLSLGAAGVVLLENPGAAPRAPSFLIAPFIHAPQAGTPAPAPAAQPAAAPAPAPAAPAAPAAEA